MKKILTTILAFGEVLGLILFVVVIIGFSFFGMYSFIDEGDWSFNEDSAFALLFFVYGGFVAYRVIRDLIKF